MPEQEPEFKPRFIEYDETLKPDRIRGTPFPKELSNGSVESNFICGRCYESHFRR
jgi:hypothetical protein